MHSSPRVAIFSQLPCVSHLEDLNSDTLWDRGQSPIRFFLNGMILRHTPVPLLRLGLGCGALAVANSSSHGALAVGYSSSCLEYLPSACQLLPMRSALAAPPSGWAGCFSGTAALHHLPLLASHDATVHTLYTGHSNWKKGASHHLGFLMAAWYLCNLIPH